MLWFSLFVFCISYETLENSSSVTLSSLSIVSVTNHHVTLTGKRKGDRLWATYDKMRLYIYIQLYIYCKLASLKMSTNQTFNKDIALKLWKLFSRVLPDGYAIYLDCVTMATKERILKTNVSCFSRLSQIFVKESIRFQITIIP